MSNNFGRTVSKFLLIRSNSRVSHSVKRVAKRRRLDEIYTFLLGSENETAEAVWSFGAGPQDDFFWLFCDAKAVPFMSMNLIGVICTISIVAIGLETQQISSATPSSPINSNAVLFFRS